MSRSSQSFWSAWRDRQITGELPPRSLRGVSKAKRPLFHARLVSSSPPPPATLESFLNSRGVRIKVLPTENAADDVIDGLSLYLGEHYESLSGLLGKIKRAMQTGMPIVESLKGRPQQDVCSACQFCTRSHEVAFLEQYQYFRSPTYLIKTKTTTLAGAQRFFGGQWLKRFILQKVKAVHAQIGSEVTGELGFEYLINPQIRLPNGDDFERDILAAMGASIYWLRPNPVNTSNMSPSIPNLPVSLDLTSIMP